MKLPALMVHQMALPMIVRAPLPKQQKQESLSTALVGAATAFAKALSPH